MVGLVTLGLGVDGSRARWPGGRERYAALAGSLVAENALRAALVAALLLAGVTDPVAYGLCLTAGPLVAVLWPSSLRFGAGVSGTGGADPIAFLTGAAAAQVIGQTVLTGGPVLLALLGGAPADVTSMFAALALFRAPYQVALGAVPQLTVQVARRGTGRASRGRPWPSRSRRRCRRWQLCWGHGSAPVCCAWSSVAPSRSASGRRRLSGRGMRGRRAQPRADRGRARAQHPGRHPAAWAVAFVVGAVTSP